MKWIGLPRNRRFCLRNTALAGGFNDACVEPRAATGDGLTPVIVTRSGQVRGRLVDGIHIFKPIPLTASTAGGRA